MAVNDKIVVADYNSIRAKVVSILGTGSANSGYGQLVQSSDVSISSRVTVNEWANLYYDITNCYVHQTGAVPPSATSAVEGATVIYNATTSPITQYDTFANTVVSNKFSVHSSQLYTTSHGTATEVWPGVYGTYWNSKLTCTVTVTFSSANAARYFFNSGGEVRFTSSLTGSTANAQTINWTSFLTSVGTKAFGGNKPNTGTDPNDNTNFYRLSNAYSVWTTSSSSSPYTSNVYRIQAKSNVADNSTGTATQIDFLIEWIDGYVDPDTGVSGPGQSTPPGDEVYGRINLNVTTAAATGVLVPSGAGNFEVESPSVSIGAISP